MRAQGSGLRAHQRSDFIAQGTAGAWGPFSGHIRGQGSGVRGQWSVVREHQGSWVEARIRSVFSALSSAPGMEVEGSSRKVELRLSETGYLNTHGARTVR